MIVIAGPLVAYLRMTSSFNEQQPSFKPNLFPHHSASEETNIKHYDQTTKRSYSPLYLHLITHFYIKPHLQHPSLYHSLPDQTKVVTSCWRENRRHNFGSVKNNIHCTFTGSQRTPTQRCPTPYRGLYVTYVTQGLCKRVFIFT